jgi:hypothetical protein
VLAFQKYGGALPPNGEAARVAVPASRSQPALPVVMEMTVSPGYTSVRLQTVTDVLIGRRGYTEHKVVDRSGYRGVPLFLLYPWDGLRVLIIERVEWSGVA